MDKESLCQAMKTATNDQLNSILSWKGCGSLFAEKYREEKINRLLLYIEGFNEKEKILFEYDWLLVLGVHLSLGRNR